MFLVYALFFTGLFCFVSCFCELLPFLLLLLLCIFWTIIFQSRFPFLLAFCNFLLYQSVLLCFPFIVSIVHPSVVNLQ